MNELDKQYTALLQDILDNGTAKMDRTGTGTISVFGRQIRHKMSEGFPLITTKKMHWKSIVTELLWFLRGDTNIKYLVDNNCHIWDGDAFKNYINKTNEYKGDWPDTMEEFISRIKTDDEFAKKWGELGPVYGRQWRSWGQDFKQVPNETGNKVYHITTTGIDQIANLIRDLKTNPDSRRLMVNAWNVGELGQMVLPPCHYGFQLYTRELGIIERIKLAEQTTDIIPGFDSHFDSDEDVHKVLDTWNIPTRAISLMWNQRSVDTFLGLPFNIASYGLLLEIIAKEVNMVPDELIGNLGDVHLYTNHIEQAKEQIGKPISHFNRCKMAWPICYPERKDEEIPITWNLKELTMNDLGIPKKTREPYPLPKLNIKLHFNNQPSFTPEHWLFDDFIIEDYQSHPTIKAPLSN
jgi:thymidylate synthase